VRKYVIHRVDDSYHKGYIYSGYDNNDTHAGFVSGYIRPDNTIELQYGVIEKEFQGKKVARCFREMIDSIQKDFKNIICCIDNKNNSAIRIVLGNGFHVIGTKAIKGDTIVELLKTKEEN
jgi:hypothetical protein